jgi:hypothetical protein
MESADVARQLGPHGLTVLGECVEDGRRLVLVGNAGPEFWTVFRRSREFTDGLPDPLDRWCRRIGEQVAARCGAGTIFPFDGPPFPPLLRWARRTGEVFGSPIGIAIHHRHGLWHAYRFVLEFAGPPSAASIPKPHVEATSPCLECEGQPCLDACPADAFASGAFDHGACLGHVTERPATDCRLKGCAARRACPVAASIAYRPSHAAFHMNAFAGPAERNVASWT